MHDKRRSAEGAVQGALGARRRGHMIVGWLGIAAFLGTGVFMRLNLEALEEGAQAVRHQYRANHIYILMASLLNLMAGRVGGAAGSGAIRTGGTPAPPDMPVPSKKGEAADRTGRRPVPPTEARQRRLGSVCLLIAPVVLVAAFFIDPPKAGAARPWTVVGVLLTLAGGLLIGAGGRTKQIPHRGAEGTEG